MTVQADSSRWQYQGNGVATAFAYTGRIFVASDLVVTRTDAIGVDSLLMLNVDYTVSGVGQPSGGVVSYPISGSPLPAAEKLTIERVVPVTQLLDLRNQGGWFPENHEDAYDRLTMIGQQLSRLTDRALRFPVGDDTGIPSVLPPAAERANRLLAFDPQGTPIVSSGAVAPSTPVSVFAETLLDSVDASDFLTGLGYSAFAASLRDDASAATFRQSLDAMENVFSGTGQLVRGEAGSPQAFAAGSVDQLLASDGVRPVWGNPVPQGYRLGFGIAKGAVAPYDVSISDGVMKDSAGQRTIRRDSGGGSLTKKLNATWVAGHDQGGRPAAVSLAASTWYHVFVIFNSSTGVVDGGFDTSPTAANLIAASGYTHYRRVGSVRTNSGPTDVVPWFQTGNWFWWSSPALDYSNTFFGSGTTTPAILVPPDVLSGALLTAGMISTGDALLYVSSLDQADLAPSDTLAPLASLRFHDGWDNGDPIFGQVGPVRASLTSMLRVRVSASSTVYLSTRGWWDPLP